MRLAVTGASGFVGGAVARAAVAAGHDVTTFSRRPAGVDGATHMTWDLLDGPLDARTLDELGEIDALVHAGGAVTDWGDPATVRAANLDGTRAVRESFPAARLVHISTASVYDPFRPTRQGREEEAPVTRYLGAYGASKAEAERYLLTEAVPGPGIVVLRPHAVYGPGDTTLLPRIEGSVRGTAGRKIVLVAGDGLTPHSLTHVDTLVRAALAATTVRVPPSSGGRVPAGRQVLVANVGDAEPVVLREVLVDLLARRGHGRVRVVGVPVAVATPLARAAERWARWVRAPHPPRLTPYVISHLALERTLDLTALREHLLEPPATDLTGAERW
ncbi:NAD(P)-dependent oxidoreductase [Actinotalea sp. BY-33]|uniref:NAD(P)-dependent oxidoreductase n=1 Tax=Actinotalea soli TaxID=2819234 RepID=A0A939LT07_9CELL|nr:NAD(P)-dependent oxidoreductase [Actinotalea soli]MBO1750797.1 NAD(P)-dependent oxidoreductase [Actinotalea soli]